MNIKISTEEAEIIKEFIESSAELLDGITDTKTEIVINNFYNLLTEHLEKEQADNEQK